MSGRLVARRYAKALVEIGLSQGTLQSIQKELAAIDTLVRASSDLERLVAAPLIAPSKKAAVFEEILAKAGVTGGVRRFFTVVAQAARLNLLHEIVVAFDELVDERMGVVNASVATAAPLSGAQSQALATALGARTGRTVRLKAVQDPALLGGIKVQVGSTVYDASLQGQLRLLKTRLLSA